MIDLCLLYLINFPPADNNQGSETDATPEDTLVFELKVRCRKNPQASRDATDPSDLYIDHNSELSSYKIIVKLVIIIYYV